MVRKSLTVAALLAVSSPLAAQDEYVWSNERPDAHTPIGVVGARVLDQGAVEVTYRFSQLNSRGVWFASDSFPLAETLLLYTVAPLALSQQTHRGMLAFGVSDNLTLIGHAEFSMFERDHQTAGTFYITDTQGLGDLGVRAIYKLFDQGAFKANAQIGGIVPIGKSRTYADSPTATDEPQPYDMRPGGGTFAVTPGLSVMVQNEFGVLGLQVEGRYNIGTGATDFTHGDSYTANGWAAYRVNDAFSLSGGLRYMGWGRMEGADPLLNAAQDPGNDFALGFGRGGSRLDLPVGVNFTMPEVSPLAGHRVFLEASYAIHHNYEGPRLGYDWGVHIGYRVGL